MRVDEIIRIILIHVIAPKMFRDSIFSDHFVFIGDKKPSLTRKLLDQEILVGTTCYDFDEASTDSTFTLEGVSSGSLISVADGCGNTFVLTPINDFNLYFLVGPNVACSDDGQESKDCQTECISPPGSGSVDICPCNTVLPYATCTGSFYVPESMFPTCGTQSVAPPTPVPTSAPVESCQQPAGGCAMVNSKQGCMTWSGCMWKGKKAKCIVAPNCLTEG